MSQDADAAACYQTAAILTGLALLGLLLGVFLTNDTLNEHRMVSTNLFALPYYKISTTALIGLQLLIVGLFLLRFRLVARVWCAVACLFLACALAGWIVTVSCDPDTDTFNHSIGAGLFVASSGVYFVILLNLAYVFDPKGSRRYDLMAYAVMLAAGVFAIVYILLYFASPYWSWLFENLAFVIATAGYVLFFWYHPFDPARPVPLGQRVVQCQPLLATHMLPESDAIY
jgi:hypothetical protein